MRLTWIVAALVLAACGKDGAKPAPASEPAPASSATASKPAPGEPAPAAAEPPAAPATGASGTVAVPNSDGLVVDLPIKAIPIGDKPGLQNDDGSFRIIITPVEPTEAQDIAAFKERVKPMVKDWLREETTADGFLVTYSARKLVNVEDDRGHVERKEGLEYGVQLRRKIGGTLYKCSATVAKQDELAAAITACNSVRKK